MVFTGALSVVAMGLRDLRGWLSGPWAKPITCSSQVQDAGTQPRYRL